MQRGESSWPVARGTVKAALDWMGFRPKDNGIFIVGKPDKRRHTMRFRVRLPLQQTTDDIIHSAIFEAFCEPITYIDIVHCKRWITAAFTINAGGWIDQKNSALH